MVGSNIGNYGGRHLALCGVHGSFNCGGVMGRTKRVNEEPTLLDLYAAMASIGVLQKYGPEALPAFVADKSFEIAQAMMEKRETIAEAKDE